MAKKVLTKKEKELRQKAAEILLTKLEENAKWIGSKEWKEMHAKGMLYDAGESHKTAFFLKSYLEENIKHAFVRAKRN
ncbi:MAG TPA: hypothetical protein VMX17_01060 [Candidatus Glassbacteria bacterium]|nr:hypothetical protein [Candidatus Glassbacteria bacterium]